MLTRARVLELCTYDPKTGFFTWKVNRGAAMMVAGKRMGSKKDNGYWKINIDYVCYNAHRVAWLYMTGEWPKKEIDHINRVRDDNRWCNLREATRAQNVHRRECKKGGSFIGVRAKYKKVRWEARIRENGKETTLGTYDTPEDAARAYDAAAIIHHGEFARLNFPESQP